MNAPNQNKERTPEQMRGRIALLEQQLCLAALVVETCMRAGKHDPAKCYVQPELNHQLGEPVTIATCMDGWQRLGRGEDSAVNEVGLAASQVVDGGASAAAHIQRPPPQTETPTNAEYTLVHDIATNAMRIALEVDAVKYDSPDMQSEIMVAADRLAHLVFTEPSPPNGFWQRSAITDWESACAMIALYLDANKQAPAPEWMREKFVGVAS